MNQKKVIGFVFVFLLIVSIGFISSGIFDIFKSTGDAVSAEKSGTVYCRDYDGRNYFIGSYVNFKNKNWYDFCVGDIVYDYYCTYSDVVPIDQAGAHINAYAVSDSSYLPPPKSSKDCNDIAGYSACLGGACVQCLYGDVRLCGPETNEGICEYGLQNCTINNTWGSCVGAVYPIEEICGNGLDDDCDGLADLQDPDCFGNMTTFSETYYVDLISASDTSATIRVVNDSSNITEIKEILEGDGEMISGLWVNLLEADETPTLLSAVLGFNYLTLSIGTQNWPSIIDTNLFNDVPEHYIFELISATDTSATMKVTHNGVSDTEVINEGYAENVLGISIYLTDADETPTYLYAKFNVQNFTLSAGNVTEPWCMEDDYGNQLYTLGNTWGQYATGGEYSFTDYCLSEYEINEYWCMDGISPQSSQYNCFTQYGGRVCIGGVCVVNPGNGSTNCSSQGGDICLPGDVCYGDWLDASDTSLCCSGACCTPETVEQACSDAGYECGIVSAGCGIDVNCGTCNLGETCSDGHCIFNQTSNCTLTSAYWGNFYVAEGTNVSLLVSGDNCDGQYVNFEVWEDDLVGDDLVNVQPVGVYFEGNVAVSSWTAEYQEDGPFGGNPEYYFLAAAGGDVIQSSLPLLEVYSNGTTNTTHLACVGDSCIFVEGEGVDECTWDGDCIFNQTCNNNGVIDPGEVCDGYDLGGFTCSDFNGFIGGVLTCVDCQFDFSGCYEGNETNCDEDLFYTSSNRLFLGDPLNKVKATFTDTELSHILQDGTFNGNVVADYTQTLSIGGHSYLDYGHHPLWDSPEAYALVLSTNFTDPIYKLQVTFDQAINFTHSDSRGETLKILGQEFFVRSTDQVQLYMAPKTEILYLSIGGDDPSSGFLASEEGELYEIELLHAEDNNAAFRMTENSTGQSDTMNIIENLEEYTTLGVILHLVYTDNALNGSIMSAAVMMPPKVYKLQNGYPVRYGPTSYQYLSGTIVYVSSSDGRWHDVTGFSIGHFAENSNVDALIEGNMLANPFLQTPIINFVNYDNSTNGTGADLRIAECYGGSSSSSSSSGGGALLETIGGGEGYKDVEVYQESDGSLLLRNVESVTPLGDSYSLPSKGTVQKFQIAPEPSDNIIGRALPQSSTMMNIVCNGGCSGECGGPQCPAATVIQHGYSDPCSNCVTIKCAPQQCRIPCLPASCSIGYEDLN